MGLYDIYETELMKSFVNRVVQEIGGVLQMVKHERREEGRKQQVRGSLAVARVPHMYSHSTINKRPSCSG